MTFRRNVARRLPWRAGMLPCLLGAAMCSVAATSGCAQPAGGPVAGEAGHGPARTAALAIEPMTTIGQDGSGYLSDPQPIRLAPSGGGRVQFLSGTTKAIIRCLYPIKPGCLAWSPLTVDAGALRAQIAAAGASITNSRTSTYSRTTRAAGTPR